MYRQWYQRQWKWLQRNPGGTYGEKYDPHLGLESDTVVVDRAVATELRAAVQQIDSSVAGLTRLVTINPAVPTHRDWFESVRALAITSRALRDLAERLDGRGLKRAGLR